MKNLVLVLLTAVAACQPERNMDGAGSKARELRGASPDGDGNGSAAGEAGTTKQARGKVSVLFFGTSLTAGYGLEPSQAFPNLISGLADSAGLPINAINAGLSGETSAGALRRIEWTLQKPVDVVVVETGGNDALRALNPDSLESNIQGIVRRIRKTQPNARILLVVMEAPPNLGAAYTTRFREAYSAVAQRENVTLVPFLLDRVAGVADLNLPDGVHPNARGEKLVAENVWRALKPVVQEVYANRQGG